MHNACHSRERENPKYRNSNFGSTLPRFGGRGDNGNHQPMNYFTQITTPDQCTQRVTTDGIHVFYFHNISGELIFDIAHPDAKVYLFGLYTGKSSEKYSLKTTQHHTVPGGYSELLIKGVFDDRSSLDYSGYIRIERDCNGAHAYQKNQNLLLSRQSRVTSEPNLEILSPDVFCTHGSTTGTVNKESIQYLMTRGLEESDAKKLIVEGFVEDLRSRICSFVPEFASL